MSRQEPPENLGVKLLARPWVNRDQAPERTERRKGNTILGKMHI